MYDTMKHLIDKLATEHQLSLEEYELLLTHQDELADYAKEKATKLRQAIYEKDVYVRGLIEVGNVCRNDCYYCGIRRSNTKVKRYALSRQDILDCCQEGYDLGFRTFVIQGGEGIYTKQFVADIVKEIKAQFPDCAITLSLGEEDKETYRLWKEAGADRYLLRHETADKEHYQKLHPENMDFDHRIQCLYDLKELGYQVGCGFMVGSPYQTIQSLAKDLKFVQDLSPAMCGIGPFIAHRDTPFKDEPNGTLEQTLYLLSLLRLIKPNLLIPSTTALGTINGRGREKGIQAGANVVMPNLSPTRVRRQYELYDNKICMGDESAQCKGCLSLRMATVGYEIVTDRGDIKGEPFHV